MKKIKSIIFRVLSLVFAILLVFVVPTLSFLMGDEMTYIYSTFIGTKSEFNGIIEVWNIDSFESGTASKTSYIENVALDFQNSNKGAFILVRNLTKGECLNLLNSGQIPDVISCSYDLISGIKNYIKPYLNSSFDVDEKFLSAGRGDSGDLYGLAWCIGYYCLISTKEKLEKAGRYMEGVKLNEIAQSSGYEYKSGKKIKKSQSLIFGSSMGLLPKDALIAYNKARSIQMDESTQNELVVQSQYSAYCSFLANDATILLGTQRDVFRMENRVKNSKVQDVIYLPLTNWSDLIQFAFVCKTGDELKEKYAEKFADYLASKDNQSKIETIGLFPTYKVENSSYNGVMLDIILENFSDLELKNNFC